MSAGKIIAATYGRLANDGTLAGLLAADPVTSGPAIYDRWGEHPASPYVTMVLNVAGVEDRAVDTASLQVDVWDRRADVQTRAPVLEVRDRIVALLDNWVDTSLAEQPRLFKAGESPEDEDEGRMRRWRMTFELRWGRASDTAANLNL